MKLIIKNWLDFIKNHTFLFVIMFLAQLVSILCIYFVYGVFQNNMYVLMEGDSEFRTMRASFDDKSEEVPVQKLIQKMSDEWGFEFDLIYLSAKGEKDTVFEDRIQYKDGKIEYSDTVKKNVEGEITGNFASTEQYAKGEKVVVANSGSAEELGDFIVLNGEEYKIIGKNDANAEWEYEIPFTAFPKTSIFKDFSIILTDFPTREDYEKFSELMREYGGKVDDFVIANNEDVKKQYSLIVVSILLALLSAGNLYIVYCYIFKQRKNQMVVCRLSGCSRGYARFMFFWEILINTIVSIILGLLLYILCLYPILTNWYEYLYKIYGVKEYILLTSIYFIITILFGWLISNKMSKLTLADFKREE